MCKADVALMLEGKAKCISAAVVLLFFAIRRSLVQIINEKTKGGEYDECKYYPVCTGHSACDRS